MEEGNKFDTGKPSWSLLPFDAIEVMVKVLDFGAKRYGRENWAKGIKYHRVFDAMTRHAVDWWMGSKVDSDSGIHPLAHVAINAVFLLAFELRGMHEFDDRPSSMSRQQREKVSEAISAFQDRMREIVVAPAEVTVTP